MCIEISSPETTANFYQRVYALVRQVPPGKVVTYGQVAALLGSPRAARAVGYALRYVPAGSDVPWHRVINYRGGISPRYPAESPLIQRLLLESEGVGFDTQDCVDLSRYRWHAAAQETKNRPRRAQYTPPGAIIKSLRDKK
jgi:methylated-DNA-protein-cysteine methyltransferase-like protein